MRCAERIVPFRSGRAYFNDSFPRVWWLNFLLVDPGKPVDPGELAADAELLHTDAGHSHRRIEIPDEVVGAECERFFRRIGWRVESPAAHGLPGRGRADGRHLLGRGGVLGDPAAPPRGDRTR